MPRLSISSWSVHRSLGSCWYEPSNDGTLANAARLPAGRAMPLIALPATIAAHGIATLELCHFHLPSIDLAYLAELRSAIASAGVELFSVLIDTGDITHPDPTQRDTDLRITRQWIERAGLLGATHVRISAGDATATPQTIKLSADNLRDLAKYARNFRVRVITENWKTLSKRPAALLEVLDRCEGEVGLCADFGNYAGDARIEDLKTIIPRATSIHAKAPRDANGAMNLEEFRHLLEFARQNSFDGPCSLIYGGAGDNSEWEELEILRDVVASTLLPAKNAPAA